MLGNIFGERTNIVPLFVIDSLDKDVPTNRSPLQELNDNTENEIANDNWQSYSSRRRNVHR